MKPHEEALRDGLNILAVIVIVLFTIYALVGCTAKKKVTEKTVITDTVSVSDSTNVSEQTSATHHEQTVTATDTTWWTRSGKAIIYDTTMPPDSATGQRPIKAIVTWGEQAGRKAEREEVEESYEEETRKDSVILNKYDENETVNIVRKETERSPWYGDWKTLSGLVFFALLAIYAVCKLRPDKINIVRKWLLH